MEVTANRGVVNYTALGADTQQLMRAGAPIALFVPGYAMTSRRMAGQFIEPLQAALGRASYQKILAFDYDWLGQDVAASSAQLAALMRGAGLFEPGTQLHVYAYSLGGLVARAAADLQGGAAAIDHMILLGSPNLGTPVAAIQHALRYISTAATLYWSGGTPTLQSISNAVAGAVYGAAPSIADLVPGSPLLMALANSKPNTTMKVLSLAGQNMQSGAVRSWMAALADKMLQLADQPLDGLFGEQNDGVVNVGSMLKVRAAPLAANERSIQVPAHHFSYFDDPDVLSAIAQQLR